MNKALIAQVNAWLKERKAARGLCDSECEGRCRVCPETLVNDAEQLIVRLVALLKDNV